MAGRQGLPAARNPHELARLHGFSHLVQCGHIRPPDEGGADRDGRKTLATAVRGAEDFLCLGLRGGVGCKAHPVQRRVLGHAVLVHRRPHHHRRGTDIDDAPDARTLGRRHHVAGALDVHRAKGGQRPPELEVRGDVENRVRPNHRGFKCGNVGKVCLTRFRAEGGDSVPACGRPADGAHLPAPRDQASDGSRAGAVRHAEDASLQGQLASRQVGILVKTAGPKINPACWQVVGPRDARALPASTFRVGPPPSPCGKVRRKIALLQVLPFTAIGLSCARPARRTDARRV